MQTGSQNRSLSGIYPIWVIQDGSVGFGTTDASVALQDNDPNAGWFKFTLSNDSNFSLDTIDSDFGDTILALYDTDGNVLAQNDDCDDNNVFTSCLSYSG
jgi:hypothetical protein